MTVSAPPRELTTEQFFRLLWPSDDDAVSPATGHINLWKLQGHASSWFPVHDLPKAAATAERLARHGDVYSATALIDLDARKRQATIENSSDVDVKAIRGTNATAVAIPGLWLDLDVGGPDHGRAHKNSNLPPTYEDALALVAETIPLEPTIIIDSGHGLYCWWLFAEPWHFETDQDREEAADLVYRLQRTLQERARAHGWEIDGTADLARVLRPPGTVNHKLDPVPVHTIEVNETKRYQPDDFDPYLLDIEWHSVVADPVQLPDDLEPADLEALPLPPYIKKLILTGNEWQDDRNAWRYGSRSQAVWRVVNEGLKANIGEATIASILLDNRFAISENPLEKGKRARTFVAREIAKARKLREREQYQATAPPGTPDTAPAAGEPQTYEEAMAELARVRRVLLDKDDQLEDCRAVLTETRAEKEAAVETVRRIGDILAQPKEHMSPPSKILTIVAILEAHSRASRGLSKLASAVLEERSGMTKNMVSACIQDLAARDGSPIKRRLTREWRTNEFGQQEPITVSEVIPLHATVGESMAAVLTMGGPSTKAQRQQEAAQERAAKSRQWGRCERHDNDLVAVKGYCPECGEVVGERVMRVEEFDALNPLNHEIRETGPEPPSTVVVRTKGHEVRETDALPRNLLAYAASRAQDPPKRCPAPGCGALELRPLPDGSWRCLKSGHDPRAYELVPLAVRGGSE